MHWNPSPLALGLAGLAVTAPLVAHARIYVSIEQAQKLLFPPARLTKVGFIVSDEIQSQMRKASSVNHPFVGDRTWRTHDGGWFIVDEVVGKHEMITYALAIRPDGSIGGIEILQYVESYGYEVAHASWRNQFTGKSVNDSLKLNKDIENISGATLSCKHITDGVKRLLIFHQVVLKDYKPK